MSGRSFRKALAKKKEEEENDDGGVESEIVNHQPKKKNAFDLLTMEDGADKDNSAGDEDAEEGVVVEEEEIAKDETVGKSKKKKKKKKKSGMAVEQEDELDRAIREVNLALGPNAEASQKELVVERGVVQQNLSIDPKLLDWEAEMKRLFGRDAVQTESGAKNTILKRKRATILCNPKNFWPRSPPAAGLNMELIEPKVYTLTHSEAYQKCEFTFYQCVATHNPDTLHEILREAPYHLNSLLQMSEAMKQNGQIGTACDFAERALYAFESSLHPSFSLTSGECRLDYNRIENRPVFIAIFRHIQYLSRKGCYRAALECSKLLFSLDLENDPLAAFLFIDFYAIKAECFTWYLEFVASLKSPTGLHLLPNARFSSAICSFEKENSSLAPKARTTSTTTSEETNNLLVRAIFSYPTAAALLFQKMELTDTTLQHQFFATPASNSAIDEEILSLLIDLYVESSYNLWKVPELLTWLKLSCKTALSLHLSGDTSMLSESTSSAFTAKSLNLQRLIVLSDDGRFINRLPSNAMDNQLMVDPFPPLTSVKSRYEIMRSGRGRGGEGEVDEDEQGVGEQIPLGGGGMLAWFMQRLGVAQQDVQEQRGGSDEEEDEH